MMSIQSSLLLLLLPILLALVPKYSSAFVDIGVESSIRRQHHRDQPFLVWQKSSTTSSSTTATATTTTTTRRRMMMVDDTKNTAAKSVTGEELERLLQEWDTPLVVDAYATW